MRKLILLLISLPLWANYPNQIAIRLDVGATTLTLLNTGSAGGTEVLRFAPTGSQRMDISASPINVPPTDSTSYTPCNDPCSAFADLSFGQWYYWAEYKDISGNPLSPRRFVTKLTVPQHPVATVTTSPLPMPREVLGQDKYAAYVQASVAASSNNKRFYIRVNNPQWRDPEITRAKMSVQINRKKLADGSTNWEDVTSSNATILAEDKYYSGSWSTGLYVTSWAHNVHNTLAFTIPITTGVVTTGNNEFGFRMNETEGITSGFYVLGLNVLEDNVQLDSFSISSNTVTVTTHAAHGWSSGDEVLIIGAPGIYGMLNGPRTITVTNSTHFTYTACGTNPNLLHCDSANGTPVVPATTDNTYAPQPVAYGARMLISQSAFAWSAAPSAAPVGSDASAGQTLWNTATLMVPNSTYGPGSAPSAATCGNCHAQDGRDLKYFNYSNYSIRTRSMFHGLTAQNGDDIAAYIRGLDVDVPTMARPWNPPFQPGPSIDTVSEFDWDAGAGIDAVNMYSSDWLTYAAPSGSYATWQFNSKFPIRQVPIQWQFQDWNHWLMPTWPDDVFKATSFVGSSGYGLYTTMRAALVTGKQSGTINNSATTLVMTANLGCTNNDYLMLTDTSALVGELVQATAGCGTTSLTIVRARNGTTAVSHTGARIGDFTAYKNAGGNYGNGFGFNVAFQDYREALKPIAIPPPAWNTAPPTTFTLNFYSSEQFMLVKMWELEHEFYLENMLAQTLLDIKGACGSCPGGAYDTKGWYVANFFNEAFHKALASIVGNVIDTYANASTDNTSGGYNCQSNNWYVQQGIVYNGNGWQSGDLPLDYPYTWGFLRSCAQMRAGGQVHILPAILGQNFINDPTAAPAGMAWYYGPSFAMAFGNAIPWMFMTSGELTTHLTQYATMWTTLIAGYSTPTWQGFAAESYMNCTDGNRSAHWAYTGSSRTVCDGVALMLPLLGYYGVSSTLINTIATWANDMWPAINWTTQKTSMCTPTGTPAFPQCDNSL